MTVLDIREDQIILFDKGVLKVIANSGNSQYNELKYRDFDGKRIFYKFNDSMEIIETYDDGIFNCNIDDKVVQIRDAEAIAFSVYAHKNNHVIEPYRALFLAEYAKTYQKELVDKYIQVYKRRASRTEHGYVIDNIFKVDDHGIAYVIEDKHDDEGVFIRKGWGNLCLVAGGNKPTLDDIEIQTSIGVVKLNGVAVTVIAKILYLLSPDLDDKTFTDQLPEDVLKLLTERKSQITSA